MPDTLRPDARDANYLTEMNARHNWHPMAHPAEMQANPPRIISSAAGVSLTDIDGHSAIDAVGGLWCVNLGYSSQPVKDAIARQLDVLPYYSTFKGATNAPVIELSHRLAQFFAADGMVRSFLTSGGSDSVDTALRLARQYHKAVGQPERTKFFSLKRGYHGTHFGGASVNGNAVYRRQYEPLLPGVFHLASPYTYRNPFGTDDADTVARAIAAQFEDEIAFQGADTIAALIMEPVQGAGGVIVPPDSFMPLMREICTRHGILLIADEVITGFGRTGAWSGSRGYGVKPDMMTCAKGITSGYFPMGAVMIGDKVASGIEGAAGSLGAIMHGYTYSGHPVGAAAALATLAETERLDLASNAAARGVELLAGLRDLATRHDVIGDVRGRGLMCGVELVSDRKMKTMAPEIVTRVCEGAYAAGCMFRPVGTNVLMSPPLIVTAEDVARMLEALETGLRAA